MFIHVKNGAKTRKNSPHRIDGDQEKRSRRTWKKKREKKETERENEKLTGPEWKSDTNDRETRSAEAKRRTREKSVLNGFVEKFCWWNANLKDQNNNLIISCRPMLASTWDCENGTHYFAYIANFSFPLRFFFAILSSFCLNSFSMLRCLSARI